MKRKKSSGGGGANWMDTYGDMVTLLLCFFVLLYSMSTISEDNWRAIVMSFNPAASLAPTATSGNNGPVADEPGGDIGLGTGITQDQVDFEMEELYKALAAMVTAQGSEETISVTRGDGKVYISFNQTVFFDGDSAVLRQDAHPVLDEVCQMLDDAIDAIDEVRVLGHTAQARANQPNNVDVDRTLSSNRATNVIIYVQQNSSLDPARLVSEGIGQWRPIADNTTVEGRAKNRRVEMIISGRDLEEELQNNIEYYEIETGTGTATE